MEVTQSHPVCRFDEGGKRFAIVSGTTVKIYNVALGKLVNTLVPPASMAHAVTCLEWGAGKGCDNIICMGCQSGQAYVWDAEKNEQLAEFSVQEEVTSVAFSNQSAFFCGKSLVKIYNTQTKTEHECAIPKGASSIAVNKKASLIVTGSKKLSVLQCDPNLKKLPVLGKFTGHLSPASLAAFIDNKKFVTGCEDERYLGIWDGSSEGDKIKSVKELQLPHPPVALVCQGNAITCLTCASSVHIWDAGSDSSTPGGDCHISLKEGSSSILAATVLPPAKGKHAEHVLVAKGTRAAPLFESVRVREASTSSFIPEVLLSSADSDTLLLKAKKKRKAEQSEAVPMPSVPTDTTALDKTLSEFQSLGFKKEELMRRDGKLSAQDKLKITQSLQQALARKDGKQLNVLLEEGLSKRLIDVSVMGLDRQYSLQLLRECTKRFQDKSSRSHITLAWIRSVLAHHPQHLLSIPDLDKLLEPLQNVVEEHLRTYNQLAVLQGRLDVVMGRSRALKNTFAREKATPLKIVSEEDSRMAMAMLPDDGFEMGGLGDFDDDMDEEAEEGSLAEEANGDVVMAESDGGEESQEEADEEEGEEEEDEEDEEN
eukprot:TRINITY_DN10472_c0_g2_i1.p1 TRINITY_DN10472_c0_g2~~TRINITY_DN10472_c0_g2_i1.p1  ORF type:complete len:597 (+),score=219.35 TRINITY_DN10472_c0_g2_i1:50-1840(+)